MTPMGFAKPQDICNWFLAVFDGIPSPIVGRVGFCQSQRDCSFQPRVARNELPWEGKAKVFPSLKGLNLIYRAPVFNPFRVGGPFWRGPRVVPLRIGPTLG